MQLIQGTGIAGDTVWLEDTFTSHLGTSLTSLGTTTVGIGGTWATTVTLSGQGSHTVEAGYSFADVAAPAFNPLPGTSVNYVLDQFPPTITFFSELSNNANSALLAKAGNVITERFSVTPTVAGVPIIVDSVTIDGVGAVVAGTSSASYTVQAGDTNGLANVAITVHDAAGNYATSTHAGAVTIDTVAPTITAGSESSSNATTTLAKAGDVVTEHFIATDTVTGVTIDGQAATVARGLGSNYTATYTVQAGDINGTADFSITAHDAAGNAASVNFAGSVTVDTVAPVVTQVSEASNNSNPSLAKAGDVITETFTSTDTVDSVVVDGQLATVVHGSGTNYTATHNVLDGDANGSADVVISAHDVAGNSIQDHIAGSVTIVGYFTAS